MRVRHIIAGPRELDKLGDEGLPLSACQGDAPRHARQVAARTYQVDAGGCKTGCCHQPCPSSIAGVAARLAAASSTIIIIISGDHFRRTEPKTRKKKKKKTSPIAAAERVRPIATQTRKSTGYRRRHR